MKAIIPAAGLGTRFLPTTRVVPENRRMVMTARSVGAVGFLRRLAQRLSDGEMI